MDGSWDKEWYFDVRRIPLIEMVGGKTVLGLMDEWAAMTHTDDWVKDKRRPIAFGDMVTVDLDTYLYFPIKYIDLFGSANKHIQSSLIKTLAYVKLPNKENYEEQLAAV